MTINKNKRLGQSRFIPTEETQRTQTPTVRIIGNSLTKPIQNTSLVTVSFRFDSFRVGWSSRLGKTQQIAKTLF